MMQIVYWGTYVIYQELSYCLVTVKPPATCNEIETEQQRHFLLWVGLVYYAFD